MKVFLISLRMITFMTLLTGLGYTLLTTAVSQVLFPIQANGSLLQKDSTFVGSDLIAQKFESDRYFWARPSAGDYNPLPSGGSNLSPTNPALKSLVAERIAILKARHSTQERPPQDLLFTSASGLDPHITLEGARFQLERVAKARGIEGIAMRKAIDDLTETRQFGILGEPRINVLKLNMALDKLFK